MLDSFPRRNTKGDHMLQSLNVHFASALVTLSNLSACKPSCICQLRRNSFPIRGVLD